MAINLSEHIQSIIYLLYAGIGLVFIGLANFQLSGKSRLSLLLIALGSLSIGLFVSLSDPFLHMWDEQVHAVVAKNMLNNPFKPMLITDPVLPYNYKNWTANHIWLHKQPLFLWQIALSFKLFGTNLLALRLPSILMTALIVFPVYRIGKIVSGKQAGIFAATLLVGSNFIFQMVSGRMHTDHNDIAFLFYVTLSIWAWFEKESSEKKYWILLIGLFAAMAILNKWLVGLLVYSIWGLNILLFKENRKKISSYLEIIIALFVTILIALPWQLYILNRFPLESKFEFEFNSLHFFEALEGHSGDYFYHLNKFETLFGTDFQYVFLVSFVIFVISRIKLKNKIAILSPIAIVYLFYSIAATKMPAFSIIVAPLVYVVIAVAIWQVFDWLKKTEINSRIKDIGIKSICITVVFFIFFHFLNHDSLNLNNATDIKKRYESTIKHTLVYKKLPAKFNNDEIIIFNSRGLDNLKILFHTSLRARQNLPSKKQLNISKTKNIKVAVFDNNKLPDYILKDTTIAKIRSQVWQKDFKGEMVVYY